jgi:predicted dehydrogenase
VAKTKKYKKASEIKVAVVGYGGAFCMGKKHLLEMQKAGMVPTAVVELDPERLKAATEDFPGIETYESTREMLKTSEATLVVLITPHNTHAPLATQCLKAGRHVVAEKPLAITTAECDRMIRAAKDKGLVLSTYHNRHWDGCILEGVDRIVKNKQIGEVVRIECHMGGYGRPKDWWRSSRTFSGGVMYDWGVHLLEYSLQLLGDSKLAEVSGFAHEGFWAKRVKWGEDTNEDEGHLVARFDNGAWLSLTVTTLDSLPKAADRGQLEITGTKGTYVMNQQRYKVIRQVNGETTVEEGDNRPGRQDRFYKNIADHLTGKAELVITPEYSRRPIHILDLGARSAKAGTTKKAKYE